MEHEAGAGAGGPDGGRVPHVRHDPLRVEAARLRQSAPGSTIATTRAPRDRTALATADPMNPEAPVMTTRSPGSILKSDPGTD